MSHVPLLAAAAMATASVPAPPADVKALVREIQELKAGQARLEKDLKFVVDYIRSRQGAQNAPSAPYAAAPADLVVDIKGAPVKGDRLAKIVVLDFNDFQ